MSPVPWSSTSYISASFHVFLNSSALSSFPYRLLCRSPRADCGTEFKSLFYCFPRRISLVVLACNMWCTASAPKTTHVKIWLPSSQNDPLRRERARKKSFVRIRQKITNKSDGGSRHVEHVPLVFCRNTSGNLTLRWSGNVKVVALCKALRKYYRRCGALVRALRKKRERKKKKNTAAAISLCRSRSSNLYGFRYEMTLARLDARAALRTKCRQKRQTLYAKECWSVCTARMHFAAS